MSDNQKLQIAITAVNQASAALKQIGTDADAMGKQVEASGKRGAVGLDEIKKRGAEVGAALGTVVAGMSIAGQAANSNRREIDALNRVYGDSSQQMQDFARDLQDLTNFSDEQGRQAALTAATLQRSYGLSTDAIEKLISRSADLAQVYGRELPDVIERTSAALRGEAEGVEVLGITLNDTYVAAQASSRGMTGWTTTMSDAEKAAFRYQLLLEQTNELQGAATEAAEGSRGKMIDLRDSVQDATVAFGNFLGPAGEALSVLGQLALGAPIAGAALGKMWAGVGALGGLGALGAYGAPAAVAAGGGYLLYDVLANANAAGNNSSDSFYSTIFGSAAGAFKWATPGGFGDAFFSDIQSQFAGIKSENLAEEAIKRLVFGMGSEGDVDELYGKLVSGGYLPNVDMGQLPSIAQSRGMSTPELVNQALIQSRSVVYDPVSKLYYLPEDYASRLVNLDGGMSSAASNAGYAMYAGAPGGIPTIDSRLSPWSTALTPSAGRDRAAFAPLLDRLSDQLDSAVAEYLNAGVVDPVDLLRSVYPGSPLNEPKYATGDAGGANYTPFDIQASSASAARSNFQTGYQVTIGQTQGMASDSQGLADFTMGLVNEAGVLGKWDDLVSRGVIDLATEQWASYANVQGEANQIFATNAEIQDDVAVIQLKQLGYMADLQAEYGATIDAISKMDEAEQRRTLAMMDSSEQAKVNEAATIAYRVATGELSEEIGTGLIEGMARADPLFADLAEQYGLIERGANGEIIVNFPEKENLISAVGELSDNVQELIDLLALSLDINITSNADGQAQSLATIVGLINAINGREATYYVNEVRTGVSIGSPSGPSITPYALHGGVVGYALGGLVNVRLAEAGPELLHFRDGGTALAPNDGIYRVPQGTYVDTAPETKSKLAGLGGGGGIHLHGPVYIYPATGDVEREFTAAVIGEWR